MEGKKMSKDRSFQRTVKYIPFLLAFLAVLLFTSLAYAESDEAEAQETMLAEPVMQSVGNSGYNTLTVKWNPSAGAESYTLYYRPAGTMEWVMVQDEIHDLKFRHVSSDRCSLITGSRYEYTVQAVNAVSFSEYGNSIKTGLPKPLTVQLKAVKMKAYNKIQIKWKQVAGASGYEIMRKENGKWAVVGTARPTLSSWTQNNMKLHRIVPGTTYIYTVRAFRTVNGVKIYGGYNKTGLPGKTIRDHMWVTSGTNKYYYVNNAKVVGWYKIGEYYYFFGSDGALAVNRVAGSGNTWYYVDNEGKRVDDATMNLAVAYIRRYTKDSMTTEQKLWACYQALRTKATYQRFYDKVNVTKIPSYAYYHFANNKGNCYRVAAAYAYIGRALGFDARVVSGSVTGSRGMSVHGWTELKKNGVWIIYDVNLGRNWPNLNFYSITYKQYPFRSARYEYYDMYARDGKIGFAAVKP